MKWLLAFLVAWPGTGAWKGLWELSNPAYAYAAGRSGKVGAAVYDDSSGALYTYNGTWPVRAASIIKVGILAATIHRAAQEGRWLTQWEIDQLGPMIRWSDNTAASNLWADLGPENVVAYLQSIGMSGTQFEPGLPLSWWGHVNTTAKDMTTLVAKLYWRQLATPELCDYGIGLMTQVVASQSWGVKGGVPGDAWVALKNGWYPESAVWRVHSVGIVKSASGKVLVVSVLSRYDVGLGMQYGIDTAREVTARVYASVVGTTSTPAAMRVTTSVLNVRSGPGTGDSILGQVYQDQVYIRTAEQGGWSRIWYAGNAGWCYTGYMAKLTGVSAIRVTTSTLNVRTGPGTGYPIAGQIYQDQLYFWTQHEGLNGWYKIYWMGGVYYCSGSYVTQVIL